MKLGLRSFSFILLPSCFILPSVEYPNFFLFTGENNYALTQEIIRWKHGFIEKYGQENFMYLHGPIQSLSDILDAVSVLPFIAEKRLVLCEGVPKIDKQQFATVLDSLHPQTLFLLYTPKLDKRLAITKDLEAKAGETKIFKPLPPARLQAWAMQHVKQKNGSIEPAAWTQLLRIAGDDQWTLSNELDKLIAYRPNITLADVEMLAVPSGSQVVWRLTDLIGSRKMKEALWFFTDQLERGEDAYGMWVILLNMLKNLAAIRVCIDAGVSGDDAIAQASGVPFFGVRSMMPFARSADIGKVRGMVEWACDADIGLKTGGYKYTAEHTGEIEALAERVIVGCS